MEKTNQPIDFAALLRTPPQAIATVRGSSAHPKIRGTVRFYQLPQGVLVSAEVDGLPEHGGACGSSIFGFHIHSGSACSGNAEDPFANALAHYNPSECPHPAHAGDLPPLFGNRGYAFSLFLTDRFSVREIIGRTVIIHSDPDDFTTQPSGNAGKKIACGVVQAR